MRDRYSVRRLLLTIVLSQALVIQGLLLAWNGALAIAGGTAGDLGGICFGSVSAPAGADGSPLKSNPHHDCRSACLMGHVAGEPSDDRIPSLARFTAYALFLVSRDKIPPAVLRKPAFLARAPPMLT